MRLKTTERKEGEEVARVQYDFMCDTTEVLQEEETEDERYKQKASTPFRSGSP